MMPETVRQPLLLTPPTSVQPPPLASIIVLNYNGAAWLERCLASLHAQTIFSQIEIIVADNASPDHSDRLAAELMRDWPNGRVIQNGCNPGFGGGSNLAVKQTTGRYLFFLNPDVWLEPDCLERLCQESERARVGAASNLVLDYETNDVQARGAVGFDLFGFMVGPKAGQVPERLFASQGFFFLRRDFFERIGGYDETFFLYCEEFDLSWRIQTAGEEIVHVPSSRMHHRGAAGENPKGGTKLVELRTSDSKRFYANRNHLLTILKNAQHVLLLLLLPALALILAEGLVGALLLRRWSFLSRSCLDALVGCWRLRGHVRAERCRIRAFRRCGDFYLLRFLSCRFSRWHEFKKVLKLGLPKVDQR